ncbi:DNA-processing protein DprA [Thauera phenolivorans]|uniref:DNA-processing protein DprA n=1 Tax=Thauera phenolivorans TaxID=1792543 RepID=UPI00083AC85F|nr:DNA-processing protein DprA [Thauera phenolivorans]
MLAASDELAAWLRLAASGLGPDRQRSLLAAFGLPQHIFEAGRAAIAGVVGRAAADVLAAPPDPERIEPALAWAAEDGNHILCLADEAYPHALLDIADPPVLLYAKGELALLQRPALAVVGARSATAQGAANAEAFARALSEPGLTIVSGLALGIDAAAHRGALDGGAGGTIAVIGTGADRIYPARNAALAREIAARGLVLSEFPLGTPPLRHNFPRRNRLIAGLAGGVLVVEAALGSGSLITARLASDSGREVFAIPGSIHSPLSKGCHRLIRDGAKLVETAEDVLEELRGPLGQAFAAPAPACAAPARPGPEADEESARLLNALGHDPVDLDTLVQRSGLTVDALYAILLPMELGGQLARLPGGRVQRL